MRTNFIVAFLTALCLAVVGASADLVAQNKGKGKGGGGDDGGGGACVVEPSNDPLNSANHTGKSFTLVERVRLPDADLDSVELGRVVAGRQMPGKTVTTSTGPVEDPIVFATRTLNSDRTMATLRFYVRDPAIDKGGTITRDPGQEVQSPSLNKIERLLDADGSNVAFVPLERTRVRATTTTTTTTHVGLLTYEDQP